MTELEKIREIQSDTLNILLCNRLNMHLDVKQRALKIAKCCKAVRDRTHDEVLYRACRNVIKAVSNGVYRDAVMSVQITENNYSEAYQSKVAA